MKRLSVDLEEVLYKKMKKRTVEEDITVKEYVTKLLEEDLKEKEKKEQEKSCPSASR